MGSSRAILAGLALAVSLHAVSDPRAVSAQASSRISIASDGTQANAASAHPALSANGRHVAFVSAATNLASPCANPFAASLHGHVFAHDRAIRTTVCVSVASDGSPANVTTGGILTRPALSANGRLVAFESSATNLDARCALPIGSHIFVRDLQAGTTECVSVAADGTEANGGSFAPVLSADGRLVAFESNASNLVSGDDTTGSRHIFVHDRLAGTTTRVTATGVTMASGVTLPFTLSADGRFVAFVSGTETTLPCICVRDRVAGMTTVAASLVTVAGTTRPALSADGRFVAFSAPTGPLSGTEVFLHDRVTGATTRLDIATFGGSANGFSNAPVLSGDGRFVPFDSGASNLVVGDTNQREDIFVHDRLTGRLGRVSLAFDGSQANGNSDSAAISATGRVVAFASDATNLVAGDTNGVMHVFVAEAPLFTGGVYVAAGDLDGVGGAEVITGAGAGGEPWVRTWKADGFPRATSFLAYPVGFTGGVFVAVGDVDGDGIPEVITGADAGGGPHVRVLKLQSGAPGGVVAFLDFFAYVPAFAGGVRVAAGNVDGSDRASIVLGAGPGGGPHVRVVKWKGSALVDVANFFAYTPAFTGGVYVAAGDGVAEIVTGAGEGGAPHVRAFTGTGADAGASFLAYPVGFTGGVRVAVGNLDGLGPGEIVTGAGPGGGPHVRGFTGTGAPTAPSFLAY